MSEAVAKNLRHQIDELFKEVSTLDYSYSPVELELLNTKLDTLGNVSDESNLWKLFLIKAWLCFHSAQFDDGIDFLNKSFTARGTEYTEGKNLERVLISGISRKNKFVYRYGKYPLQAIALTYAVALIAGLGTRLGGVVGSVAALLMLIGLLSTFGTFIRWLIVDRWGIGYREVIAKVCIFIIGTSLLIASIGISMGTSFNETAEDTKRPTIYR